MRTQSLALGWLVLGSVSALAADSLPPQLHPDNPHYLLWRGQPTIIITSGEHYGAVLNLDFDYRKYLDALGAAGLNNTRTFAGGAYLEPAGAFNIVRNTLAPEAGRFACPFARSSESGYAGGGNQFDLSRWDAAYFARLRDFVAHASKRGVIVEMNLFCPFYDEAQWKLSPFHAGNNVNGLGNVARTNVYTLDQHGGLLAPQEAMVRKFVAELRDCDNVYYEICNEPYFGGVTLDWQRRIADVITEAQKDHPHPKLISQNIANGSAKVTNPHPQVSIFNFHYAAPPDTVALNYALNKVIGDNETGFRGTNDAPYRMEAWDFIIAGGALFNHLDYSFVAGHEDGTFVYPASQPGGGNPTFRKQLGYLRDFIYGFDFVHMKPDGSVIQGSLPSGVTGRALANPGKEYALYFRTASLPSQFSARWTGEVQPAESADYTFHTLSNDGVRLWVAGQLLIDNWTEHSATEDTAKVRLEAGKKYPVRLEYFYAGGAAVMKLFWSSANQSKQIIPSARLSPAPENGRGLTGEYFADMTLNARARVSVDAEVNFDWGDAGGTAVAKLEAGELRVNLAVPSGAYRAEWFDTKLGRIVSQEEISSNGGIRLEAPAFVEDIALRVIAAGR